MVKLKIEIEVTDEVIQDMIDSNDFHDEEDVTDYLQEYFDDWGYDLIRENSDLIDLFSAEIIKKLNTKKCFKCPYHDTYIGHCNGECEEDE